MSNVIKILVAAVVVLLLIAAGPLLVIWALNTVFPVLAIPYTLATWAGVLILGTFLRANVSVKR